MSAIYIFGLKRRQAGMAKKKCCNGGKMGYQKARDEAGRQKSLENANEESKINQNDCNCNLTDVRT